MRTEKGTGRFVIIFNSFVIKIPMNLFGYLSNVSEIFRWYRYRKFRYRLCPIFFHDPLCLFIIAANATDITNKEMETDLEFLEFVSQYLFHPIFIDSKTDNFGRYKGRIVKRDYGRGWIRSD